MTVHTLPGMDGTVRRAFTVAEFERMGELGIIGEDENVELIEGEIIPMASKNHVHERVKSALNLAIARQLPDELWLGIETSLRVEEMSLIEPDLSIYPRPLRLEAVRGPDVSLAIEVSDTSFRFDKGRKARLYARIGVQELWVVEANERTTFVHTGATANGWTSIVEVSRTGLLMPSALGLRSVSVCLADWD